MAEEETLPPPVSVVNEEGSSPYVLICEHASRFIPRRYEGLGLAEADLKRHIAWDIGASNVALQLSHKLDSALVLAGYSRLLIDLNRPVTSPTSIPQVSESTLIPGNTNLTAAQRHERIQSYFAPFQSRVERILDLRLANARPTVIIGVHSFTPIFKGDTRPWQAGVLYRRSRRFGEALVQALGGPRASISHNEPYRIDDVGDYTVPVHGEARGIDAVLIEIRQDLITDERGAAAWAGRLSAALKLCAAA